MEDIDIEFIVDEKNRDDIEYIYSAAIGEYGLHRLSGGRVVYVSPPMNAEKH